jgi:hypothetical protein
MAAYSQGGTIAFKREQTRVYDIDQYYRYEITSTTSGAILGGIFLRKDEVDAADAVPDTIAITKA